MRPDQRVYLNDLEVDPILLHHVMKDLDNQRRKHLDKAMQARRRGKAGMAEAEMRKAARIEEFDDLVRHATGVKSEQKIAVTEKRVSKRRRVQGSFEDIEKQFLQSAAS